MDTGGQGGSHAQSSRDWYQLEKKKEEKLIDTDRKLYISNWNKHPVSRTDKLP